MKKILLPLLGTAAFIIAVGFLVKNTRTMPIFNPTPQPVIATSEVTVGSKTYKVEVSDTQSERELGLGKRKSLSEDQGMLFVFGSKQIFVNFWMKEMEFPIDIIWIANNKIIKIDKNVPDQKGDPDNELKIYSTQVPIDYVLEFNAGFSDKNKIKIGDSVDLSKAL